MRYLITNRREHFSSPEMLKVFDGFATMAQLREALLPLTLIAIDKETTSLSPWTGKGWCTQFGTGIDEYIIDEEISPTDQWPALNLEPLRDILEDETKWFLGHNLVFDFNWILKESGIRIINARDTMLRAQVHTAGYARIRVPLDEYAGEMGPVKAILKLQDIIAGRYKEYTETVDPETGKKKKERVSITDLCEKWALTWRIAGRYKYDIASCQIRYLGSTNLDKDIRETVITKGITTPETLDYSFKDVDSNLFALYDAITACLKKDNMLKAVEEVEEPFLPAAVSIMHNGLPIDPVMWRKRVDKLFVEHYQMQQNFEGKFAEEYPELAERVEGLNWASSAQVGPVLKAIGCKNLPMTEKGHIQVTIDTYRMYQKEHPILKDLITLAEMRKQLDTYGYQWCEKAHSELGREPGNERYKGYLFDNRIHSTIRILGADTGRISAGNKSGGPMPNIANIPNDIGTRECFRKRGRKIVGCDYSSQESFTYAANSGSVPMLEALRDGKDLHCFAASLTSEFSYEELAEAKRKKDAGEELTAHDKMLLKLRQTNKQTGLGAQYGATGYTISVKQGISLEAGNKAYNDYCEAFGFDTFFKSAREEAADKGYVLVSPLTGRRKYFDNHQEMLWLRSAKNTLTDGWRKEVEWKKYKDLKRRVQADDETLTEKEICTYNFLYRPLIGLSYSMQNSLGNAALNAPSQGMSSEMTKIAARMYFDMVRKPGVARKEPLIKVAGLCNFVYDELVAEATKGWAKWAGEALKACMEAASKPYFRHVSEYVSHIPAEPDICDHWPK